MILTIWFRIQAELFIQPTKDRFTNNLEHIRKLIDNNQKQS